MPEPTDPSSRPFPRSPAEQLSDLGDRLTRAGRYAAAVVAYRHAITREPEVAELHNALGIAQHRLGEVEAAMAAYRRALELNPAHARAQSNLGAAHMDRNEPDLAIAAYERALVLSPGYPKIRVNLAFAQLVQGDLPGGWRNYEARRQAGATIKGRTFSAPPWLGETSLAGRSLLLVSEQGLGDMIQFARYVPEVARQAGRVHLEVEAPLRRLFAAAFPGVSVSTLGEAVPAWDEYCPVPSLPLACGTDLGTIPSATPYLTVPVGLAASWTAGSGRPRIGLAWSGSVSHHNDFNRSIPFARFQQVLAGFDFRWICLHKEVRESDAAALALASAVSVVAERLGDLADTAALIAGLDLVIAVDTSVAHLAGALGKPVWLLVPQVPDWRWLLDRGDSPWYPTLRIFRQAKAGDWESVLAAVRAELSARFPGA